jgi:hypothetical protein
LSTGEYPYLAQSLDDLKAAHLARGLRPLTQLRPDLPSHFVSIVERAISLSPNERFQSAAELRKALTRTVEAALELVPSDAPATTASKTAWPRARWAVAAGALAAIAAVLAGVVVVRRSRSESEVVADALRPEQRGILSGYLELGDSFADREQWEEAASNYGEASGLLGATVGIDQPFRSVILAAWAAALGKSDGRQTLRRATTWLSTSSPRKPARYIRTVPSSNCRQPSDTFAMARRILQPPRWRDQCNSIGT